MEAGDGALTPDRNPAPSRDANRSPAVPPRWSQLIVMFQTGVSGIPMLPMNTRRASAPDPTSGKSLQRTETHAIRLLPFGPAVAQGIVARMGGDCPAGSSRTTRARSRLCRDVPKRLSHCRQTVWALCRDPSATAFRGIFTAQ